VCVMIAVLFLVRPAASSGPAHGSLLDSFTDSLAYIRGHAVFKIVIMTALLHSAILMGYSQVLPVFAKSILEVDARGLGIMASAAGVGSLGGLLSYSWLQARTRPRDAMVGALTAYSVALMGVAWSDWLWFSVALLAVVGLSHAYFMTSCQVIIQTLVPDHLRGRVMGVFTMVWSLVYLSAFLLNFAGAMLGPRFALAGGAAIILTYTWLYLVRSHALRDLVLAPRDGGKARP
jgi:predicted MFS family arabinose efflux permease